MIATDVSDTVVESLEEYAAAGATHKDSPNYWNTDPRLLITSANIHGAFFGTGHQIYQNAILPAIEGAEEEVILVTCFWARSLTLDDLCQSLRKLSAKATRTGKVIKVRICFSSSSLWQKLSQTSSLQGHIWPASRWPEDLGLPRGDEVPGLEIEIKSIFQLPFSVMHPKYVVIDRRRLLLPSCNVSWEEWFEGCIVMSGPVVQQGVLFWQRFWASDSDQAVLEPAATLSYQPRAAIQAPSSCGLLSSTEYREQDVDSMFLPSPHHRFNIPWLSSELPPPTPLNIYLLTVFARAARNIYVQTPNLTSSTVISELLVALGKGVDVTILTSRKLMRLEQIVTAGTTTQHCVRWLIKQYEGLRQGRNTDSPSDIEAGLTPHAPGRLVIRFYEPHSGAHSAQNEPVQSHLKLTLIDDEVAVFGSGNMDRASWHTSQELGVALCSEHLVREIWQCLSTALEGRSATEYDSEMTKSSI